MGSVNSNKLFTLNKEKKGESSLFFTLSNDAMCITDADGIVIQANEPLQELLGISLDEIAGTSFLDYVHTEDLLKSSDALQLLKNEGKLNAFVNRYRTGDGSVRHLKWQAKMYDTLIYASAKDITDEINAREKLFEQKEVLESILENMQEGFAMSDLSGRIVRVNDAFCSMVGFTREELIGEYPPYRHWPPEEANEMVEMAQTLERESDDKPGLMVWLMKKDGTRFPVRVTPANSMGKDETIRYVFANFQNFSREEQERQGKERALDLLERSNEVARIGTWEMDFKKGVICWSRVTKQIHEVPDDYVPGLQAGIDFYKEGACRERISRAVRKAIETGEPYDVTARIVTANGREIWVRAIGIPEIENGSCVRFYGLFRDIHQTRELVDKLKIALDKERELSALKSRFISTVSHEFRTPLATIQSSNDILNKIYETAFPSAELPDTFYSRHQHHVRRIDQQVGRLRSILGQILVLEESSLGRTQSIRKRKDLAEWLVQLQDENYSAQRYGHKALRLVLPDGPCIFETDYRLLRHVLMNLLENAYKFSATSKDDAEKAPELHLQTQPEVLTAHDRTEPDRVVLKILDYGIGIPDDARSHIFDLFFRATNVGLIKGVGLGLSVVQDLVDNLGGKVNLCGNSQPGTCFTVTLPGRSDEQPLPQSNSQTD